MRVARAGRPEEPAVVRTAAGKIRLPSSTVFKYSLGLRRQAMQALLQADVRRAAGPPRRKARKCAFQRLPPDARSCRVDALPPRFRERLVALWRASFEQGVGAPVPNPLDDHLRYFDEHVLVETEVQLACARRARRLRRLHARLGDAALRARRPPRPGHRHAPARSRQGRVGRQAVALHLRHQHRRRSASTSTTASRSSSAASSR